MKTLVSRLLRLAVPAYDRQFRLLRALPQDGSKLTLDEFESLGDKLSMSRPQLWQAAYQLRDQKKLQGQIYDDAGPAEGWVRLLV